MNQLEQQDGFKLDANMATLRAGAATLPRIQKLLTALEPQVEAFSQSLDALIVATDKTGAAGTRRQHAAKALIALVNELRTSNSAEQSTASLAMLKAIDDSKFIIGLLSLVAMLVAIVAWVFIVRKIVAALLKIEAVMRLLSDAKFESNIPYLSRGDEIGAMARSLHSLVDMLRRKIGEAEAMSQTAHEEAKSAENAREEAEKARGLAEVAKHEGMLETADNLGYVVESIIGASSELEAQVEQVRSGADHQRDLLRNVVQAIAQMTATVLDVAKNASRAAQSAEETKTMASTGAAVVEDSMSAASHSGLAERSARMAISLGPAIISMPIVPIKSRLAVVT